MRIVLLASLLLVTLFLAACGGQNLESKNGFTVLPTKKPGEEIATFAGGCFWAMQECMLELKGVTTVVSGYAGGTTTNPDYETVLTGKTGHAESVQVYYDPRQISFEQLTTAFFNAHDPTQINRQGPDVGSDYRSIAFFRTADERKTIIKVMNQLDSARRYTMPLATEITAFSAFYPAEAEHQDYYVRHKFDGYIRNVSKPKVLKLRKALPELIKNEYLD
ncbi:peptide-methionine (S)-S-oxide reductase MsrA [Pedobacter deserti]|uniref:peptide-methionine (S)-S-oxide reductase MsrA n=1 Tax=Pedobacter deserti TaxID=2817382 RepID=UPI00210EF1E5|nr:peptide-methionine (S)-S-oxide reductase MsrA [Pedobacter sp. SYSU D00382]